MDSDDAACHTSSDRNIDAGLPANLDLADPDSPGVYFGPFQSPEKKFLPMVARRQTLSIDGLESPLRRSPRLSPPRFLSPLRSSVERDLDLDRGDYDSGDEGGPPSTSGTPENDRFPQDEPSSVLASRIIRAHDNPSPPPRPQEHQNGPQWLVRDSPFNILDVSRSPTPYEPLLHVPTYEQPNSQAIPELRITPSINLNDTLPLPSLTEPGISPSPMSHPRDKSALSGKSTPATDAQLQPSLTSVFAPFPTHVHLNTVGDLLSRSPSTSPPPQRASNQVLKQNELQSVPVSQTPTPSPLSSPTRDQSPTARLMERLDDGMDVDERPVITPSSNSSGYSLPRKLVDHSRMDKSTLTPPLRRSPRRSPTPQSPSHMQVERTATPRALRRSPRRSPTPQLLVPANSESCGKGKVRAISPIYEIVSDSQDGRSRSGSVDSSGKEELFDVSTPNRRPDIKGRHREVRGLDRGSKAGANGEDFQRELRSLSPGSTSVLKQLLPSIRGALSPDPNRDTARDEDETTTPQPPIFPLLLPQSTSIDRKSPVSSSPGRVLARAASPVRLTDFLDDPMHTPARVPLQRGNKSSQKASPWKLHGTNRDTAMPRTPVFSRPIPDLNDPMLSPKRVISPDAFAKEVRSPSPVRSKWMERGESVEPRRLGSSKTRSGSAESPHPTLQAAVVGKDGKLTMSQSAIHPTSSQPPSKLPYPIIASSVDRPKTLPEDSQPLISSAAGSVPNSKPAWNSSPAKSSLRQPSRSKIPRIGAKPYSRPPTLEKTSNLPVTTRKVADSTDDLGTAKPFRLVRTASESGSSSSSDDSKLAGPNFSSHRGTGTSERLQSNLTLKRKRGAEKVSQPDRPPVMIRQVPDPIPPKFSTKTTCVPSHHDPSPKKHIQGPIVVRRVADVPPVKRQNNGVSVGRSSQNVSGVSREYGIVPSINSHPAIEDSRQLSSELSVSSSAHSMPPPSPGFSSPSQRDDSVSTPEGVAGSSPSENGAALNGQVRRTSRLRKPTQTVASDVFGTINVRPSQTRRKATTSRSEGVAFSGMSAVALKALTNSNTARNQQYLVAKLETEVIRKEGTRPESPSVKVKTIAQRQQEEKGLQRQARAERRARRDDDTSDLEGQSDLGHSSIFDGDGDHDGENGTQNHPKHRRGPGEDEDYESPVKKLIFGDEEEDEEEEREQKRVKWDRGLSTAIYVDELQPGKRRQLRPGTIKKGCLAVTAKTLRLDTLGNIVNTETPLSNLVHENVVVKKFVYDNDVEPEVYVPRPTRSRGRKSKN